MTETEKRPEKKREKGVGYLYNPKLLKRTKIIDCIPQEGKCPLAKTHDCGIDCFFQDDNWYISDHKSNVPSRRQARGKIVRFNCGNDSNIEKELVRETAKKFDDFFFNTSIRKFNFPGPVVYTCNSKKTNEKFDFAKPTPNLMFVRFRTNAWNVDLAESVIAAYSVFGVPIVLTMMRYRTEDRIPLGSRLYYKEKTNVSNPYFMLKKEARSMIVNSFREKYNNIFQCGTYESSYCKDCGNCEKFYYEAKKRTSK